MDALEYCENLTPYIERTIIPETLTGSNTLERLTGIVVEETGINRETANRIVNTIFDTINETDATYQDLKAFKVQGRTTNEWLHRKLNEIDSSFAHEGIISVTPYVLDGFADSNAALLSAISKHDGEQIPHISYAEHKSLGLYEDLNAKQYVKTLTEAVIENLFLSPFECRQDKTSISKKTKEYPLLKQYFESPLDSPIDSSTKKAISIAVAIAREKKQLPLSMQSISDDEIASIVDMNLTKIKTAYKVGKKEMSVFDAVDYLIDRIVSSTVALVKQECKRVSEELGEKAGEYIKNKVRKVFGETAASLAKQVTKTVIAKAGETIGNVAGKGIEYIGEGLKKTVHFIRDGWENVKAAWHRFLA